MKVYLCYPWKFPDSPYYKYLFKYPPESVKYVNSSSKFKVISSSKIFKINNIAKNLARAFMSFLEFPNVIKPPEIDVDLFHCAHCLVKTTKPWVVDIEHYWIFSSSGKISYSQTGKKIIKKLLLSKTCKKILPWTKAAEKSLLEVIQDREIKEKTQVLYPAVPCFVKKIKKNRRKSIILLFVARRFWGKGGLIALEVMKEILNFYEGVECICISPVPERLKKHYSQHGIKIFDLVPQSELMKFYERADVLIYPGFSDTFGFALLEAMAFGMAIITANGFARNEIVENNKGGFVIEFKQPLTCYKLGKNEKELVEKFVEKTKELIDNSKLRKKMGKHNFFLINKGKFSIKERNERLVEIYESCLKR